MIYPEKIKILYIEDNLADVELIREALADQQTINFDLEHAGSLAEGLTRLAEEKIDLVLLDLSLPDSDGFQTFQTVKAKVDMPVIVMTGTVDEGLAIRAVQEGAQDYLIKDSVNGANLLMRAIRYAIGRKSPVTQPGNPSQNNSPSASGCCGKTSFSRFASCLLQTDDSPAQFCIRVALAIVIFPHGAQKVLGWFGGPGFTPTLHIFSGLGFPIWSTILLMITEFFGPILLVAGLASRAWALALGISMTICMFMNHVSNGFFMNWFSKQQGEGFEYHLLILGMVTALLWRGSGAFSLDRLLSGKLHSGSATK